jgi:hypothetical protein
VHRSDESDRDYIATSDAVSRIYPRPQKNILRPVDAPKNAGQSYAKRAFRRANGRFFATAQLRNTCTIFNHAKMAERYYYLGCIFVRGRQPERAEEVR